MCATTVPTLFHLIIKNLQKSFVLNIRDKSNPTWTFTIQKYSFAILGNCARSSECKNVIWKSNLLLEFTGIDSQGTVSALRFSFRVLRLWLMFILSLSFNSEGQQFIMKCDGLLSTIIKLQNYYQQNGESQQQADTQYMCLLILRNVSFNQSNKSKLISNGNKFEYFNSFDML